MAAKGKIEQAAARRASALTLRMAGASYRAIGLKLGVSHVQALADVKTSLAALKDVHDGLAEDLRTLELARLDWLLLAISSQVSKGHLGAVDRALKISERRARFLGLDMPFRS